MTVAIFLIFAFIAVVCAINVVVQTHPISSAISLVGVMGSLAVLYLQLGAEFIAASQVIVLPISPDPLLVLIAFIAGHVDHDARVPELPQCLQDMHGPHHIG